MLSELLHTKPSYFSITAYTNNQSLYDAVNNMKQTLEKCLLIDISTIQEMAGTNEITVTWINKKNNI